MSWVRLDDQFADHPKVAGLSNDAFCLHVTAMCWTAKQQTDGKLPSRLLSRLAWRCQDPATAAAELQAAGVWDKTPEGWEIHDFLVYNPTKEQAAELAAKRSEAGKAGATARWQSDGKSHGSVDGKTMPPSPSPSPSPSPIPGSTVVAPPAPGTSPTYPSGFTDFERNFVVNLINAIQEREPGQRFQSGLGLSDTSRAALLQVMNGGPLLSAKAIDWALDQWEQAKPNERFDATKTGCVNWMLATINNSYKPGSNGNGNHNGFRPKAKTTSAELDAIFGVDIHGNPV